MTNTSVDAPNQMPRRWPWFIIGVALFLLGPILMFVQFGPMEKLATPWQVPILATLGALCMLLSVLQRGGALRIVGFFLFMFFSGFEWYMLLVGITTPVYAGPQPGSPLPAFAGKLADGRAFANTDLASGQSSVLLFYRGHW